MDNVNFQKFVEGLGVCNTIYLLLFYGLFTLRNFYGKNTLKNPEAKNLALGLHNAGSYLGTNAADTEEIAPPDPSTSPRQFHKASDFVISSSNESNHAATC